MFAITFPHVPGIDVAGTIVEIGTGVTNWSVGDQVVGLLPMDADGAAADYVVAPVDALAAAPRSIPLADAAALPTAGLSAWQALFEIARLTPGQTVLINGASGAVGGYAVQLASQAGAIVTATTKAGHADRLREYGAARIVDYIDFAATPLVDAGPFDVVLNLVSTTSEQTAALVGAVADEGVHLGTMVAGQPDSARHVRAQRLFVRSDPAQLTSLVDHIDSGRLRTYVADRRPLADLPAVHEAADSGRLPGKTIVLPPGQ